MDAKMAVSALTVAARAETGRNPEAFARLVALPELMGLTVGAPDVAVALIDGPIADHPDLAIENIRVLPRATGMTCASPQSAACTHGTYVAGILHARRNSLVPGICPGCMLLVRPIFPEAAAVTEVDGVPNATMEELATAIVEVMDSGARVINLSVGLSEPHSHFQHPIDQALDQAARRGVIIVAAAGNQGRLGSSAITRHPWVIPVVACDDRGYVLTLSNLGASIGRNGVTAPGHDITSLAASGGHATFSGSSAAVPFVTGTAALLWSIFPRASAAQLRAAITGSLVRRRSVNPPLLDVSAAYRALTPAHIGAPAQ
jgi:subtilisin family serine protease